MKSLTKFLPIVYLLLFGFLNCTGIVCATGTSNSWIMDEPKLEDEIPRSKTTKEWWGLYGHTYTADGLHELLIDFNILREGGGWVSFTIDGDQTYLKPQNNPIWEPSKPETFFLKINQKVDLRLDWYPGEYRVFNISSPEGKLIIETQSRGIPLWHARTEDEMIAYRETKDGTPTYLGGFGDCVLIEATFTTSSQTLSFSGFGMYGRGWTKELIGDAYYRAIFINHPKFYVQVMHDVGPYTGKILYHGGRIGFPDKGIFRRFDNFTYWDSGPAGEAKYYKLTGNFEGGQVNLMGEKIGFLRIPSHHPYIRWNGTVTVNGETINVANDAFGSGEIHYDFLDLKPAEFTVSDLSISPAEAEVKQKITISVKVTNVGELGGSYTVDLKVAGEILGSETVTLMGGKSTTVTFEIVKEEPGIFDVYVADQNAALVVKEIPSPPPWGLYATIAAVATAAVGVLTIIFYRKRRE